ncbi:AMP-binding enzyme, putative [Coccidioides posadasii C735 delta SOWgp]|uniref:AMP-binding enzyme, putative n=1 Tax=Coccidioides posadasii (strain C735) TaxID=222929 RepID=C5PII0_COCP7|nr:AMP-binding enzyme, putative [Coccidioides posadasii C735 delta SOWgp]EER24333.1 AMP-binding enzyme, putative [Coccidioides posadasii C735 delta SOWgp]|eukprot:XP_003066478.1 AMP-binding enzyme, putative [Coccidioides posadasii C735 delta SOWgp]
MHLGIRKSRGPRRNCRKAIGQTSLERRPTHSKLRRVPTPLNIWSTGSDPSDIAIPDTSFDNCEEEIYSTPDKQRREDVVQIKASGNSPHISARKIGGLHECCDKGEGQLGPGQRMRNVCEYGAGEKIWPAGGTGDCALYSEYNLVSSGHVFHHKSWQVYSLRAFTFECTVLISNRAGCMVAGASPAYNVEEMTYALKTADAKFLMTSPGSIEVAAAAAQKVGIPRKHIFLLEGEVQGYTTFKQLQDIGRSYGENGQAPPFQLPVGRTNKGLCGFLNFSSGTTGLPKAVMLSHHNVIAQCMQLKAITPPVGRKTVMGALPLFHITGLVKFMNCPMFFNDELIMLPQFNMELMLQTIVEYQISELVLVPPLVIRLVNDPVASKYDLSCVKRISCGAAPLSEQITQLLQQKFPQSGFKQGYGMTESCSCITSHSPKYYDYKYANTVGDIVPSTSVKIIDDNGKELGYNQPGEIIAKGPQIAMGYLGNPTATAEAFDTDGFLHTGDIGYMTEEGLIRIVDRIKEMIKVKGIAVAPAELEDLLLGHPDVADCAVLGVKDDYAGEKPKAYVVLRDGLSVSEEMGKKLMKYVSERKVRFKWVEEIEFTDAVPKSPSGKILRRVLREKERSGKHRGFTVKRDGWDGQRAKL